MRKKQSLENLSLGEKRGHIEWVLHRLEHHRLLNCKLVHLKSITKTAHEAYRREVLVLKDPVSWTYKDRV